MGGGAAFKGGTLSQACTYILRGSSENVKSIR